MSSKSENQGEGDRAAAKRYYEDAEEFAKSGKVEEAGRKAGEGDKADMERAEKAGKDRAKEFDPAVERDYSGPTK